MESRYCADGYRHFCHTALFIRLKSGSQAFADKHLHRWVSTITR